MTDDPQPIIDRPARLSDLRKRTEWSLTAVGWVAWMLLCRPVLMTLLWVLGLRQFYVHMIQLGGATALLDWLRWYVFIIAGLAAGVLAWNRYNWWRFHGADRRRRSADATPAEMAAVFGIAPAQLQQLQAAPEVSVRFLNDHKLVLRAEERDPRALLQAASGRYDPAHPLLPPLR